MRAKGRGVRWFLCTLLLLSVSLAARAQAREALPTVTVRALHHAYHNAIVTVALPLSTQHRLTLGPADRLYLETSDGKERRSCQLGYTDEYYRPQLSFVEPDLAQGATRTYRLRREHASHPDQPEVRVTPRGPDMEVSIGSALFTRYTTHSGPNKPFFYPILTPDGSPITRRWPMEATTDESHDHPHHRGLWFTHGNINGIDFWSEEKGTGKTENLAFRRPVSGPVYGGFEAETAWRAPDGKLIATDRRWIRVYALPNGDRVLDFTIQIQPTEGLVVFGDTKEGTFGLRVADTLAPARKQGGHIETSTGNKDGAAWGKAAEWVDYWGPIHGQTYGVAIFDHPGNLRHPQTWHARDYGLFAVNPFGLHDFGLGPEGAGDYTVPQGGHLTLRYRLLFHRGDTAAAQVAQQYAAYADPPQAEARW